MTQFIPDNLVRAECATCYHESWIPRPVHDGRKAKGELIYCPNGHSWRYAKTEADDLREEVESLKRQLVSASGKAVFWKADAESSLRRLNAARGFITRLKTRLKRALKKEPKP